MESEQKITRVMFPTASFSLTVDLIKWIEAEAKRRDISKSLVVREVLTAAKDEQEATAA
jgi:hypothetical protein